MAQTVRIDESTHALLRQLAEEDLVSLQEELALAVQARRREKYFADMASGYAEMTEEERSEDAAEISEWEGTLSDGLEKE